MLEINRRGFLKLFAATTAVATIPKPILQALEEPQGPISGAVDWDQLTTGIYVRGVGSDKSQYLGPVTDVMYTVSDPDEFKIYTPGVSFTPFRMMERSLDVDIALEEHDALTEFMQSASSTAYDVLLKMGIHNPHKPFEKRTPTVAIKQDETALYFATANAYVTDLETNTITTSSTRDGRVRATFRLGETFESAAVEERMPIDKPPRLIQSFLNV